MSADAKNRPRPIRLVIGGAGVALGLFGVFRLLTQIPVSDLFLLVVWLLGALVIHDGILSPIVVGISALLEKVPARARRYLQAGLLVSALITVVALPLIRREGSQPAIKAILRQNYAANLGLLIVIVTVSCVLLYVVRVARDRQASSATNVRPPNSQHSSGE